MSTPSVASPPFLKLQVWLRRLLLLGPLWYVLAASYVVVERFSYRFELEWMEGGSLIQVLRLLDGKSLYVPPSLSYIPYIYPPLYYYLAALAAKLTGIHWFTPLRLVSIAATLGCLFLIWRIVSRLTGSRYWGLIAAGLFAASFRIGGAWFDIARVDMLSIFLFLAGTYALIRRGRLSAVLAGELFALSFYTKQTVLIPVLAILAYLLLFRDWRTAVYFGAAFAAISISIFFFENIRSSGWYSYYVFHLPSLHRLPQLAWLFLFAEGARLLASMPAALVLGMLPFLTAPRQQVRTDSGLFTLIVAATIAISVVGNAQPGGYENAYLPALATIPILAGLGGHWLESQPGLKNRGAVVTILYAVLFVQFAALFYSVPTQIPTSGDARAGEELVASIAATPGEVLIPFHGYLALLAGKNPSAHQITLAEIQGDFGRPDEVAAASVEAEIQAALRSQRYSRILLDRLGYIWEDVPLYYQGTQIVYADATDFYPVTGAKGRPNLDYTPK